MRKVAPVAMPRGTISFSCGRVYSSRGGQFLGSAEVQQSFECNFTGLQLLLMVGKGRFSQTSPDELLPVCQLFSRT